MAHFSKDVADVLSKYSASQVSPGSPETKPSRSGPSIAWSDSDGSEGEVRSIPVRAAASREGARAASTGSAAAANGGREPSLNREDISMSTAHTEQSFARMPEPRAPPAPQAVSPPVFQPGPHGTVNETSREARSETHNTRRRQSEITSSTRTREEMRYEYTVPSLPLDRVQAHQVELSPEFAFSRESEVNPLPLSPAFHI